MGNDGLFLTEENEVVVQLIINVKDLDNISIYWRLFKNDSGTLGSFMYQGLPDPKKNKKLYELFKEDFCPLEQGKLSIIQDGNKDKDMQEKIMSYITQNEIRLPIAGNGGEYWTPGNGAKPDTTPPAVPPTA